MTIVEISRRVTVETFFNLTAFVYKFYVIPEYPLWAPFWTDTFGVQQERSAQRYFITGFFMSPNTQYEYLTTEEDVIDTEESFYWDHENQVGTVHIGHAYSPQINEFSVARADGFTDEDVVYISTVPYRPLILAVPTFNQSQDLHNYTIPAGITGSIKLDNHDAILDELISEPLYGNSVNIYSLPVVPGAVDYDRSDMTQLASLYIDDYDFSLTSITFRIQDKRKYQDITIPQNVFTTTEYPNIEDKFVNKPIPIVYGEPNWIPAICTNGTLVSGNVDYTVSEYLTITGSSVIQVDTTGAGSWSTVSPVSTANGEFVLSSSDARDANGHYLAARIGTATGYVITKLTNVIFLLNYWILGVEFDAANYDVDEWLSEGVSVSTGSVYINKEIKLSDAIEQVQNGANVGFRYEILPDGRRTIRIDNEARTSRGTIRNVEILNRDELSITTDSSTLAAEVVVSYYYDYSDDTYSSIVNNDDADIVETEYRQRPRYPESGALKTFLNTSSLAEDRAQYIIDRFSTIRGIVELEIIEHLDIRIYDIWDVELTPSDFVDGTTISGREYFGIRKIKVIEIEPNAKQMTNTIKAIIID